MAVTHAFSNPKADGGDSTIVRPSNWNAAHVGNPFEGVYNCADYNGGTKNATTIQAAIAACNSGGGGIVYVGAGTWSLGSTSITFPGNNIILQGAGREVTYLDYTGTGAAVKNSATGTTRYHCGLRDLCILLSDSGTGAIGFECWNFCKGMFRSLRIKSQDVARTCLKMYGDGSVSTYYNSFRDCHFTTSGGIAIWMTGGGGVNRNVFDSIMCDGNGGQALVMDPTTINTDTNVFYFLNCEEMSGNPCISLGGAGASYGNRFFGLTMENCANGVNVASNSGSNYFFAPILANSGSINLNGSSSYVYSGAN